MLWRARERRLAHEQGEVIHTLKAVEGLQSLVEQVAGPRPQEKKDNRKFRATEFENRLEDLKRRGYKRQKRPLTAEEKAAKRKAQIAAFIGGAKDERMPVLEVKDAPDTQVEQGAGRVLHETTERGQGGAAGGDPKARRKRRSPRPKSHQ